MVSRPLSVQSLPPSAVCRWFALASLVLPCLSLTLGGCSTAAPEPQPADASSMASAEAPSAQVPRLASEIPAPAGEPIEPLDQSAARGGSLPFDAFSGSFGEGSGIDSATRGAIDAARASDSPVGKTQLPPDLTASQLVEFLGVTDRDMQELWSRLAQIPNGRAELIRIARLKLEAARRLKDHAEADARAKSAGIRGELQALSHLASFNDLRSAQELERLATEHLQSDDAELAADSRLVLIGFALESLQHGEADAPDRVLSYIDQIVAFHSYQDVPTLMVMGQARDALAGYGYTEHAERIRAAIVKLYADSPNPDLAMAAAELAGNVLFDELDKLLMEVVQGREVSQPSWRAEVERVISAAPDVRTVEFLAGAALQLEAVGQDELVEATFDALSSVFPDPSSEAGRELRIAIAAKDARQEIVGVRFNPVLPSVNGEALNMDDFSGQVVLVPFWAAAFPESLQLVPLLKEIQEAHPEQVAIVGVNLDGNDALLREFVEQYELPFPSLHSKSQVDAEVANVVAAQFGIASMPFLAILDQQGRVAAINFTGRGIEEKVNELLMSTTGVQK